jgi:hypothetical protein
MNPEQNGETPQLNWKDSIAQNIAFFRDQARQLEDIYNPSQVASGAIMTVMIMNHNMVMGQIALIQQRLDKIEKSLEPTIR